MSMSFTQPNPPGHGAADKPPEDLQLLLVERQLCQLAELRELAMTQARDLAAGAGGGAKTPDAEQAMQIRTADAFGRLTKVIRQIMALEQETIGMRETRAALVRSTWMVNKKAAVRQSVERSIARDKPGLDRNGREKLLGDLSRDYNDYARGSVRDIVEGICKALGITADLSLWEEPHPADVTLRQGFEWTVPANGDKPYTTVVNAAGDRIRQPFDSPHLARHGADPPRPG
jgi:hypothetical protein